MRLEWKGDAYADKVIEQVLSGVEEWARAPVLTQCKEECPTDKGIMKGSLTVVREDNVVYIGGGGPAKDYIYRQHQDMTLNHPVGKAKFITDPVNDNAPDLPDYIKKHTQ